MRTAAQNSSGSTQVELNRLNEAVASLQRTSAQSSRDLAAARALAQQLQGANTVLASENYQLKTMLSRTTGTPASATAATPVSVPGVRTHVVAAGTVVLSARLIGGFFPAWTRAFLTMPYGGPTLGVVGAVLVASATLPTLWRRRVRVGALALFTTMVLFYGGGLAVLLMAAAVAGLVLGRALRATRVDAGPVGSVHEARVLASVIVAATAIGPLLAMLTPVPTGPFSTLGFLVADVRRARPDAVARLPSPARRPSPRGSTR